MKTNGNKNINTNNQVNCNIGDKDFEHKDIPNIFLGHLGLKTGGLAIYGEKAPAGGDKWQR